MTPTIVKKVFEAALARDWIGSMLLPFSEAGNSQNHLRKTYDRNG